MVLLNAIRGVLLKARTLNRGVYWPTGRKGRNLHRESCRLQPAEVLAADNGSRQYFVADPAGDAGRDGILVPQESVGCLFRTPGRFNVRCSRSKPLPLLWWRLLFLFLLFGLGFLSLLLLCIRLRRRWRCRLRLRWLRRLRRRRTVRPLRGSYGRMRSADARAGRRRWGASVSRRHRTIFRRGHGTCGRAGRRYVGGLVCRLACRLCIGRAVSVRPPLLAGRRRLIVRLCHRWPIAASRLSLLGWCGRHRLCGRYVGRLITGRGRLSVGRMAGVHCAWLVARRRLII